MSRNKKGGPFQNWLVVEPTHLKNMSQIGMNIDQILELPPARISEKKNLSSNGIYVFRGHSLVLT